LIFPSPLALRSNTPQDRANLHRSPRASQGILELGTLITLAAFDLGQLTD
jgi:hypothetical protein